MQYKGSKIERVLIITLLACSAIYVTWALVHEKAGAIAVQRKQDAEDARKSRERGIVTAMFHDDLPALRVALTKISRAELMETGSLRLAAYYGNMEAVKILLDLGLDANGNGGSGGPLRAAAQWGYPDVVRMLLDHGASPNPKSSVTTTPLILAARRGSLEIVRMLVDAGADVNAVSTPQPIGFHGGFATLAPDRSYHTSRRPRKILPVKERVSGGTALIYAVQNGFEDVVKLLLSRGAKPEIRTPEGESAVQVAKRLGYRDIQGILAGTSATIARAPRIKTSSNR